MATTMKKNTTNSSKNLIGILLLHGYSVSFIAGANDAVSTTDRQPWLFAERLMMFRELGIDAEEFVKGFNYIRTMEAINV